MRDGFHAGMTLGGRYRLTRPLGQGGMGAVWVARQISLERDVAVKVLLTATDDQRPRLRREALALAAVHHPAIVQVYDYDETPDGWPFVVLELVDGETLFARLAREGSLTADRAIAIALPLLEGLAAAHRAGVIHRDVKPENVLLARGPAGVSPKLLDFGIATTTRGSVAVTSEGGVVGTPSYMAPEQVLAGPTDERTDVWGAAVLIYEMIAGTRPFGSDDMFVVMRRVVSDPPPYPRNARGLDGRLWSILMSALRKDAKDRTPSALAFHDALSGWQQGRAAAPRAAPAPISSPAPLAPLAPTLAAPIAPPASAVVRDVDDEPSIDALIRAKLGGD